MTIEELAHKVLDLTFQVTRGNRKGGKGVMTSMWLLRNVYAANTSLPTELASITGPSPGFVEYATKPGEGTGNEAELWEGTGNEAELWEGTGNETGNEATIGK